MSEIDKLAAALVAAQHDIENPKLDSKGNFNNDFASLESSIDAVRPVYAKHGLVIVHMFVDNPEGVGVEAVIVHESGQMLRCGALKIPVAQKDAQKYCSAVTYARRFTAQAAAFVTGEKDDDGQGAVDKGQNQAKANTSEHGDKKPSASDIEWLKLMGDCKKALGDDYYRILGEHGFVHSNDDEIMIGHNRPDKDVRRIKAKRKVVYDKMTAQIQANAEAKMDAPDEN